MLVYVPGSGVAGGMAGIAAAIPAFRNYYSKAPPSGHFVFTGCHTKILLPATPLLLDMQRYDTSKFQNDFDILTSIPVVYCQ